ncbi:sensor histidine kinase [Salibacterium halotolerans]|uniref:histidine kinase n=1 Tax=Salibacterium halotolerans TaxID=1884432 RepID=A0A1I5W8T9_9BACI|nr:sensor histidine kinase [Salibacterium halotolerans]SFQ15676.1 Signal transduction histidine kinase [Salibacterium halotolerans]
MKTIIYTLFLILASGIAGCGSPAVSNDSAASNGVMTLPEDGQGEEVYTLDGEWEFYWQRFVSPSEVFGSGTDALHVQTPSAWSDIQTKGGTLPDKGYGTYHLEMELPENLADDTAGIYIPEIATAYTLWVDQKVLAENGKPGVNRSSMEPEHHPQTAYFKPESDAIDLVLQVSEYYQRKSGWWDSFYIGSAEDIQSMRDYNISREVFLVVSLLVMGLYHFGIFVLRPSDRAPLFFGGLCLAVAVRTLLLGEVLFLRFFAGVPWEWMLKFEYWSSCLGIVCAMLFIYTQYKNDMNILIRNSFLTIFSLMALGILVTPALIFTEGMLYLQSAAVLGLVYINIVLWTALVRRRKGALAHTAATFILLVFVVNDTLHYNHVINTGETVSIGVFVYLFAQSFILASRFTSALTQSRQLSDRLEKANQTLEDKVERRTRKLSETNQELEDANHRLERMYRARQELMSNISHELGTPMTSIQGYIKGMLDGVVDRGDPTYLKLVYNKTLLLQKITDDLRELAKLESGGITYTFEERNMRDYVETIYFIYKEEIERKGISFTWEDHLPPERNGVVSIDPIRMEQVLSNLLLNARKFTPAGGTVTLVVQENESRDSIIIAVRDDGPGIEEEELPNVFKRFFRGGANVVKTEEGVGLGLAISAEIVRSHGGEVGVESRKGEGSLFYFLLPVSGIKSINHTEE